MPVFTDSALTRTAPYPITWEDDTMPLLGLGRFGCVVKSEEERVHKRPDLLTRGRS